MAKHKPAGGIKSRVNVKTKVRTGEGANAIIPAGTAQLGQRQGNHVTERNSTRYGGVQIYSEDLIANHLCKLEVKRANLDGWFSSKDADRNCVPEFRVSSAYLLSEVLGIDKRNQGQRETKRLADVMRSLGWELAKQPIKVGKKTCRASTRPQPDGQ
jgi:hypothetical protein